MWPLRTILLACVVAGACTGDAGRDPSRDSMVRATQNRLSLDSSAACFVAEQSVLARAPNTAAPGPENLRGWIQLFQFGLRDSSAARLVDSDGSSLEAFWRGSADSIVVQGANDFVTIQVRLRIRDSAARGSLQARSDAALERDSSGKLREFERSGTIDLVHASCDSMPKPAGTAAIDVLPGGSERPGIQFNPSTIRHGTSVGLLVLDSITVRQAVVDSTYVGTAQFRGEIQLRGWTMRHPDPDASRVVTCFEADSSSAARLPRWRGDERRAWFCFSNNAEAVEALGPPSEGVRATIVVDQFTIHRGLSDEVNSARLVRLVRRGPQDQASAG